MLLKLNLISNFNIFVNDITQVTNICIQFLVFYKYFISDIILLLLFYRSANKTASLKNSSIIYSSNNVDFKYDKQPNIKNNHLFQLMVSNFPTHQLTKITSTCILFYPLKTVLTHWNSDRILNWIKANLHINVHLGGKKRLYRNENTIFSPK